MDLVLNSCTDKMSSWSVVLLNGEHRVWPRLKRVNASPQLNALSSLNLITVSASAGHCHTVIVDSLEGLWRAQTLMFSDKSCLVGFYMKASLLQSPAHNETLSKKNKRSTDQFEPMQAKW